MSEEVVKFGKHYCTVKTLKEYIAKYNIPDDAIVMMQRVEDVYFGERGWPTIKKKGDAWRTCQLFNEKIDDPELPGMKGKTTISEEEMEKAKTEYYPCWSPVIYRDEEHDKHYFYLDAHY